MSGERKSETKTQNNGTTKSEFYYGKFQRVIPLSARIQNTNVTADYKDGILNLALPKSEQENNKVVKVNIEPIWDLLQCREIKPRDEVNVLK
ncbi:Hsp20/alpha crystallin family protein [Nostoc punctiforme UO1]